MTTDTEIVELCQAARNLHEQGDVTGAIRAAEQALAAAQQGWPADDLRSAEIAHNLGVFYLQAGRLGEALRATQRALALREVRLPADDPRLGNSLESLAQVLERSEQFDAALETYERVLALRRAQPGSPNLELAQTLQDYGVLLLRLEHYEQCSSCFAEAQRLWEQAGATSHWYFAALLTNQALAHQRLGRPTEAERCYLRALELHRAVHGPNHPRLASVYANLAELYRSEGRLADAEHTYSVLLSSREGSGIPLDLQEARLNFGLLRADQGRYDEAIEQLLTTAAFDNERIADRFGFVPHQQRLTQTQALMGHVYVLLTLMLRRQRERPELAELAHTLILRRKALVQDTLAFERRQQGASADYLRVALAGVDASTVRKALPADAVLIEYFKYAPYAFGRDPETRARRWRSPRYLALVIPNARLGPSALVDLGEAAAIDPLVAALHVHVAGARDFGGMDKARDARRARDAALALRQLVIDPLARHLEGAAQLLIAADGELSLVPFEILPRAAVEAPGELIDRWGFRYLSTGRDVLRAPPPASRQPGPPLVIADPNYDLTSAPADAPALGPGAASNVDPLTRLRGSRDEGVEVARLLGVPALLDDQALVAALKTAHAPRVLHIATHGFFTPAPVSAGTGAPRAQDDPLRASGLAFAGANTRRRAGPLPAEAGDGVLYASDVAQLDLTGTELVVLSACDTGRGQVRSGEGVFGLRRAFVLAGASTLVLSLWKVSDTLTKELMIEFYRLMQRDHAGDPARALREAKLALRARRPELGVASWGAFICQSSAVAL